MITEVRHKIFYYYTFETSGVFVLWETGGQPKPRRSNTKRTTKVRIYIYDFENNADHSDGAALGLRHVAALSKRVVVTYELFLFENTF